MKHAQVHITGIGSVSSFGPIKGTIPQKSGEPRAITSWPTLGLRKAFLVEPFVASAVIPGLKTRRLDRLSIWALVASSLALQDAGFKTQSEDLSRGGVVFGTGFGPLELTGAFCTSAAEYGCSRADAIVFPETLDNTAACHVAKAFGIRGPNITLSCRGISGEAAIIRAASILECGEADFIVVMAGDTLVRALFEYYERTGILASDCYAVETGKLGVHLHLRGFIPGEGLAAFVMETGNRYLDRGAKSYGRYLNGLMGGDLTATPFSWGHDSNTVVDLINEALDSANPSDVRLVVGSANGSSSLDLMEMQSIEKVFGTGTVEVIAPKKHLGEFDGNALLRLAMAFSRIQQCPDTENRSGINRSNLLLLLGASTGGGRAAVTFALAK
jgi:3-oxoacyl-(acyl-carrier-protein) synthase